MNHAVSDNIVKRTFTSVLTAQLFSFLAQIISIVVDGVITGKCLGKECLAAYGFAGIMVSLVIAFSGFCMTGISILCAKSIGDRDENHRTSAFTTSMVFTGILSIVITMIMLIFASPLSSLAGATGALNALTAQYIVGFGIGIIPNLFVSAMYPLMQLDGDKKRMLFSFMAMSVVDIILDLLNGYVLGWGLFGMGLATSISSFAAFFVLLGHFFKKNNMFHFKWSAFQFGYVIEIITYGYMYIVKQILMTVLTFLYNNFLMKKYGADMVAAYTAIFSAGSMFLCLGMAMGSTVSVMTGVYSGEKDGGAISRMMNVAYRYSVILNGILTAAAVFAAEPLISAYFKGSSGAYAAAVTGFRLYSLVMIVRSINLCIRGYYQSMKMQKLTFGFSVLHTFVCSLAAMFVMEPLIGINGVWLSFAAGEFMALIILVIITKLSNKKEPKGFDFLLYLPEDYKIEDSQIMERSLTSMDDVLAYSKELQEFCKQKGASASQANNIALAVEEMAGNIIKYGFSDHKKHSIDVRITRNEQSWILRFRDDCMEFNPVKYLEENERSTEHIGIYVISKQAKDIQYMNTLNMNNLVIQF